MDGADGHMIDMLSKHHFRVVSPDGQPSCRGGSSVASQFLTLEGELAGDARS